MAVPLRSLPIRLRLLRRWCRPAPIEEFHSRGALGERTIIVHCVWLDDREVQLMAQTGTALTHCPCSNMKLSSGPARVGFYRDSGVTVGLGSDGEKENNNPGSLRLRSAG